jgi:hypothetical protein
MILQAYRAIEFSSLKMLGVLSPLNVRLCVLMMVRFEFKRGIFSPIASPIMNFSAILRDFWVFCPLVSPMRRVRNA